MKEFDHLAMMKNPNNWPQWPILPIKRPDKQHGMECAIMYAEGKPVIYFVNMWELSKETKWSELPKKIYESFESLLADGWVVD